MMIGHDVRGIIFIWDWEKEHEVDFAMNMLDMLIASAPEDTKESFQNAKEQLQELITGNLRRLQ